MATLICYHFCESAIWPISTGMTYCVLFCADSIHSHIVVRYYERKKIGFPIANMSCGGVIVTTDKRVKWKYPTH